MSYENFLQQRTCNDCLLTSRVFTPNSSAAFVPEGPLCLANRKDILSKWFKKKNGSSFKIKTEGEARLMFGKIPQMGEQNLLHSAQ